MFSFRSNQFYFHLLVNNLLFISSWLTIIYIHSCYRYLKFTEITLCTKNIHNIHRNYYLFYFIHMLRMFSFRIIYYSFRTRMGRSITRWIRRTPFSSKNNISLFNSLKIDLVFIYIYTQLYINSCYGYLKFTKITHFIYSFIRVYFFSFIHTRHEYFHFGRVKCVLFIVSLPTIHYRRYSSMIRTWMGDFHFRRSLRRSNYIVTNPSTRTISRATLY